MPRKTEEKAEQKPAKKTARKTNVNKTVSKTKTSGTASNTKATVKSNLKKSSIKSKKTTTKKSSNLVENTKVAKTKKSNVTNKKTKIKKQEPISVIEYYDLPARYNQTIVKILAQTPQMLFVYWDISDSDRKYYEEYYGSDFFSKTKPVLIVHNETMDYSFEVEINDFANTWYLHVNDANCKYEIELGRRPYSHTSKINADYINISSSNEMYAPNNHILFEKFNPSVDYKNIKTGISTKKDFSKLSNYKNMQEIYSIYDLYKQIYKDELFNEISDNTLLNPSSMNSSFMESSRS